MVLENIQALSDDEARPNTTGKPPAGDTSQGSGGPPVPSTANNKHEREPDQAQPKRAVQPKKATKPKSGAKAKAKAKANAKCQAESSAPDPASTAGDDAPTAVMRRPSALKRPAASERPLTANKYIYNRDGVWGIKMQGKEVTRVWIEVQRGCSLSLVVERFEV